MHAARMNASSPQPGWLVVCWPWAGNVAAALQVLDTPSERLVFWVERRSGIEIAVPHVLPNV
eukprot:364362-Chlamydomonas_euryale.AAC.30